MKVLLFLISLHLAVSSHGTNYYISTALGDDMRSSIQAQNPSTPWKSISKLNSFINLKPGDSVLFRSGETYYGELQIQKSGNVIQPIVYASYGTGARPVISGFSQLSVWTNVSGNIYYATLQVTQLKIVTLDGVVKSMGRYPNSGYLKYTAHQNNSISGTIASLPFNPAGGEVVIRKDRHIIDRHIIKSRSANALSYTTDNNYGDNNVYKPFDGNGFFIQNHLSTLDAEGEWYFDATSKRLYMHFGSGKPDNRTVKASNVDRNFVINSQKFVSFVDLDFIGGNISGAHVVASDNNTIRNCNFNQQGCNGIYGDKVSNLTVSGGTVSNCLNNGILVDHGGSHVTVDRTTIQQIGKIAGAAKSGDVAQEGIFIFGNYTTISNCSVNNTGYNGIAFDGDNAVIKNNLVDSFCLIKDDGGGIYTYTGDYANISNNVVLNGIGSYQGAEWGYWEPFGKAAGIYLDNGTKNHYALVTANSIAHCAWAGIFVNNNGNNKITNNLVFDCLYQLFISDYTTPRNLSITSNQLVAKKASQRALQIEMGQKDDLNLLGYFNANIYARPIDDNKTICVNNHYTGGIGEKLYSLSEWKSSFRLDSASSKSYQSVADMQKIRFEYNASQNPKTIPLSRKYVTLNGKLVERSVTIEPFTAIVLIESDDQGRVSTNEPTAQIEVYSNPASNFLRVNFHLPNDKISRMSLSNTNGREVKVIPVSTQQQEVVIDISTFSQGCYFLTVKGDGFVINRTFLKH